MKQLIISHLTWILCCLQTKLIYAALRVKVISDFAEGYFLMTGSAQGLNTDCLYVYLSTILQHLQCCNKFNLIRRWHRPRVLCEPILTSST